MASDHLHVVHVTPTISRMGGGVATFLWESIAHLREVGVVSTVLGLDDPHVEEDVKPHLAAVKDLRVFACRRSGLPLVGHSPELRRHLDALLAEQVDVVHCHGMRLAPEYEAYRAARRHGCPLIASPHGQLDPWVVATHRLRKLAIGALYQKRALPRAACFHATALQEARHIRAAGLQAPVSVTAIGLDASGYAGVSDRALLERQWPQLEGRKVLLYMSTVYPKKRLPALAEVWSSLHAHRPDWLLVIGGQELSGDRIVAERIIRQRGASADTLFLGAVDEATKRAFLACSQYFVLPTAGENFGITIAEALASELPVITSNTTPWSGLRRARCGWWIDVDNNALRTALEEAMDLDPAARRAMGQRGRRLIETEYHWPSIARQMADSYAWLAGAGPQPDHVIGDGAAVPEDAV